MTLFFKMIKTFVKRPPYYQSLYYQSLIKPYNVAYISTSKKSKDTASLTETLEKNALTEGESSKALEKPKNWVSWGTDEKDIVEDRTFTHLTFFLFVTICFIGGGFIWMYQPDNRMFDWVRREAFLELRRRELNGLPLVDRELVPPENLELPSDEELGDIKIII